MVTLNTISFVLMVPVLDTENQKVQKKGYFSSHCIVLLVPVLDTRNPDTENLALKTKMFKNLNKKFY